MASTRAAARKQDPTNKPRPFSDATIDQAADLDTCPVGLQEGIERHLDGRPVDYELYDLYGAFLEALMDQDVNEAERILRKTEECAAHILALKLPHQRTDSHAAAVLGAA